MTRYSPSEKNNKKSKHWFLYRAALRTGFSIKDINEVYTVFDDLLDEAIEDVHQHPGEEYNFGPFRITCRKVRQGEIMNQKTKEIVSYDAAYFPWAQLRPGVKEKYRGKNLKKQKLS